MVTSKMGLQAQFLQALLQQAAETAVTFLYPAQCRVCAVRLGLEAVPYMCAACWQAIRFVEPPWCDICGTPSIRIGKGGTLFLPASGNRSDPHESACDECASNPPRYGKLRTIAFYEAALQEAIHLFKFQKRKALAKPLIQLITAHMPADCNVAEYDFILPVPIHKKRLRERGFNQATLLANGIAKTIGVPVVTDVLVRHLNTSPQSSLDREARQTNIIGAFELRGEEAIRGKRLLVIDDVFTTGATIREVVKVLWNADPAEIDVLTLARTLNP